MADNIFSIIALISSIISAVLNYSAGPLEDSELAIELAMAEKNTTTFVQMSDTQLGFLGSRLVFGMDWADDKFADEANNFVEAVTFINAVQPEFAIICGDLVHNRKSQGQIDAFKNISGSIHPDITLYLVSGNHDVDNAPTKESLESYRKVFGKDWYGFVSGNIYGIVLNSTLIKASDILVEEATAQREWLEKELISANVLLAAGTVKHIFVFQHHQYFKDSVDEKNAWVNIEMPERRQYLELFASYNVEAVFAGHMHENALGEYKNIKMITTSAIGTPNPLGKSRAGLRVVRAQPTGIQHAFIAIKDLNTFIGKQN